MANLVQQLWPTQEILKSFLILFAFKIALTTFSALYQKRKARDVLKHHGYWLKASQMLDDEMGDERKKSILRQYIRLQEEKVLLNGHALAEVQNDPKLAMQQRDFLPMIINFGSFQLLRMFFQDRNPVVLCLPFDVNPPFTMLIHFGSKQELRANQMTFNSVNFILGLFVGRIINRFVFGKRANIGVARKMEIMQLKMQPAVQGERIRLAGYEYLQRDFPDIDQALEDEKTD